MRARRRRRRDVRRELPKMAAAALDARPPTSSRREHVSAAEMDASLNDLGGGGEAGATTCFLVAPERTFRRDALGAIYAYVLLERG